MSQKGQTHYKNLAANGSFSAKFKVLNKEPTCFKSCMNPSSKELYLTNCPKSFERTLTTETGLSNFHKLVATVLKAKHEKVPPKYFIIQRPQKVWLGRMFWKTSTKAY